MSACFILTFREGDTATAALKQPYQAANHDFPEYLFHSEAQKMILSLSALSWSNFMAKRFHNSPVPLLDNAFLGFESFIFSLQRGGNGQQSGQPPVFVVPKLVQQVAPGVQRRQPVQQAARPPTPPTQVVQAQRYREKFRIEQLINAIKIVRSGNDQRERNASITVYLKSWRTSLR